MDDDDGIEEVVSAAVRSPGLILPFTNIAVDYFDPLPLSNVTTSSSSSSTSTKKKRDSVSSKTSSGRPGASSNKRQKMSKGERYDFHDFQLNDLIRSRKTAEELKSVSMLTTPTSSEAASAGLKKNKVVAVGNSKLVYFLTHFHADHYRGLSNTFNQVIYCSSITRKLVLKAFPGISTSFVKPLRENHTHCIALADDVTINVTPLSANHCPGAVMYLFEGYFGRYLHTGDFRFSSDLCKNLEELKKNGPINHLFLDTTFLSPIWVLPTKDQAVEQVLDIITKHRTKNQNVYLECGMLGTEQLFIAVAKRFNVKIHVEHQKTFRDLSAIGQFSDWITTDSASTWLFLVKQQTFSKTVFENSNSPPSVSSAQLKTEKLKGLFIKPSTQWFGNHYGVYMPSNYLTRPCFFEQVWHVLYSIHSSYEEIIEFVKSVQPESVTPIADCSREELKGLTQYLSNSAPKMNKIPNSINSWMQNGEVKAMSLPTITSQNKNSNTEQSLEDINRVKRWRKKFTSTNRLTSLEVESFVDAAIENSFEDSKPELPNSTGSNEEEEQQQSITEQNTCDDSTEEEAGGKDIEDKPAACGVPNEDSDPTECEEKSGDIENEPAIDSIVIEKKCATTPKAEITTEVSIPQVQEQKTPLKTKFNMMAMMLRKIGSEKKTL